MNEKDLDSFGSIFKKIEKVLENKKGKILYFGCCQDDFFKEASKRGWEPFVADILNFKSSLFADHNFDVIVLKDIMENINDPKKLMLEIKRILKTNGYIYISTQDVKKIRNNSVNNFYYFSKNTLVELLKAVSFNVISIEKINKDQISVLARRIRNIAYIIEKETADEACLKKVNLCKKKVIAVLPAYNAEDTLELTIQDIPKDIVDEIILVDDCSKDGTYELAKRLGLTAFRHEINTGYGGNQKTCYAEALKRGADIIVMVHPDYQYDPKIIKEMVEPIASGKADVVFASRMMKGGALEGGMPLWKHNVNITLTAFANIIFRTYLTEYHSGFRAYSREVLENIKFDLNKDNFVFDFEVISQIMAHYYKIEEVPIKTRYFDEASSIKIIPAMIYGLGILKMLVKYWVYKRFNINFEQFK